MAETRPTRRRWFQFSLGTVFWITVTVALTIVLIREHRENVELRQDAIEWAQQRMRWFEEAQQLRDERTEYREEQRKEWEQNARDLAWILGIVDTPVAYSESAAEQLAIRETERRFGFRSADLVASAHREGSAWFVVVSKANNEVGADFHYQITDDGKVRYSKGSE